MKTKEIKFNKREQKLVDSLKIGPNSESVANAFSGERVVLTPLGVALHDIIKGLEFLINREASQTKAAKMISQFDLARNLFRKLYPDEYMTLLD